MSYARISHRKIYRDVSRIRYPLDVFFDAFVLSYSMRFTVTIIIYFLWRCGSALFRRSGLSCALTDNTSPALKEKVPKHRGSYVIRHKWYCQALLTACVLYASYYLPVSNIWLKVTHRARKVLGVLATSWTGNGNGPTRKVDTASCFCLVRTFWSDRR